MKRKHVMIVAMAAIMLTGCNLDNTTNVVEMKLDVLNHYSPEDEDETPSIAKGSYSFTMDMNESSMTMRSANTGIGGANNAFVTKPIDFKITNKNFGGLAGEMTTFSLDGDVSTSQSNITVNNLIGELSSLYYFIGDVVVPGYPAIMTTPRQLVMNYELAGKYKVRTFSADSFYGGKTVTTDDSDVKFESDNMVYRVKIDPETKKCVLIIYECRFSESMPMTLKAIVLEGLELTVTRSGYEIKGENIVPLLPDGEGLTQFPSFVFDSVEINTIDTDLTEISVDYAVKNVRSGAVYNGAFSGKYVVL